LNCSNSVLLVRAVLALGLVAALPLRAAEMSAEDSAKAALENARKDALHPHGLLGTVDTVNAITMEQIVQLAVQKGMKEVRERYVGKVVTFKGLIPVGVRAKNEKRQNVCMQGFLQRYPKKKYYLDTHALSCTNGSLRAFFNFGDEIKGWLEYSGFEQQNLPVEHPLNVPFDVCDTVRPSVCQEGDIEFDRKCIFSTERLLVAGKIVAIEESRIGRDLTFDLRPTGLRY
jgi:hypothetical protein